MAETTSFTLNGKRVLLRVEETRKLLWVLRTELAQTGAKYGCGRGSCGACVVLVDEKPVRSCMAEVKSVDGKKVTTIEGLAEGERLHPLQKAFMAHDALQCGFCTPGMILAAVGLLRANRNPSREDIVKEMDQNLCRCGAHTRIIDAIQTAAAELRNGKPKT
ncbi:MAG: 2Fe-2S iron-sulfur cluster binding domain-containing protein [Myxococcales bacterium]|jgi:aerobic-type carbon monoxide dehydrogenase small subunit (CoxS/CutS family)|nr:2Fe-2S iron-sulfur cluster binding domain-containing protein [Myxococcales bacterium]